VNKEIHIKLLKDPFYINSLYQGGLA